MLPTIKRSSKLVLAHLVDLSIYNIWHPSLIPLPLLEKKKLLKDQALTHCANVHHENRWDYIQNGSSIVIDKTSNCDVCLSPFFYKPKTKKLMKRGPNSSIRNAKVQYQWKILIHTSTLHPSGWIRFQRKQKSQPEKTHKTKIQTKNSLKFNQPSNMTSDHPRHKLAPKKHSCKSRYIGKKNQTSRSNQWLNTLY